MVISLLGRMYPFGLSKHLFMHGSMNFWNIQGFLSIIYKPKHEGSAAGQSFTGKKLVYMNNLFPTFGPFDFGSKSSTLSHEVWAFVVHNFFSREQREPFGNGLLLWRFFGWLRKLTYNKPKHCLDWSGRRLASNFFLQMYKSLPFNKLWMMWNKLVSINDWSMAISLALTTISKKKSWLPWKNQQKNVILNFCGKIFLWVHDAW